MMATAPCRAMDVASASVNRSRRNSSPDSASPCPNDSSAAVICASARCQPTAGSMARTAIPAAAPARNKSPVSAVCAHLTATAAAPSCAAVRIHWTWLSASPPPARPGGKNDQVPWPHVFACLGHHDAQQFHVEPAGILVPRQHGASQARQQLSDAQFAQLPYQPVPKITPTLAGNRQRASNPVIRRPWVPAPLRNTGYLNHFRNAERTPATRHPRE